VAANIALAVALMGPLAHAGVALASSLSAYVNLFTLLWALRRRLGPIGGRALVRSGARTLLATVALVLAARALAPAADTGLLAAAHTAGAIAAGAAAFVAAAAGLRAPELGALLDVLRRRR
jgi:putative peptidoglycan lipid II flippase